MNGSITTDAQTTSAATVQGAEHDRTPGDTAHLSNGADSAATGPSANGARENEPESEAETLITSPVKKAEAAKQNAAAHRRNTQVMAKDGEVQDDEQDAPGSPDSPGIIVASRITANPIVDNASARASSSDDLSEASDDATSLSDSSQHSRSASEQAEVTNPRKRKHRASSVSLPNKRPSIDATRRRKRDATEDRSDSPRSHRRAISTQSLQDGVEPQASRKRRLKAHGRENSKSTRAGWDEESMSSEATSHGQQEQKRPQRGVGRSTSTPGRPVGREAKRHVNKYGYTRLAEACEVGDLDLVKEWRQKDHEALEIAEFAGNKPLQIAAINGNAEVVKYLIDQGCQIDCENEERDTPLIDAAENGHADVVDILLHAGVDPLRQNRKGQQALDVINDETDNVTEIRASLRAAIERWSSDDAKQRREEEEEQRYRAGPSKELHFMARSYDNLLRLVTLNDRNSVREFLDARVPVDNAVIAAAAKTGDLYLVNMLLAEMPEKKRYQKAEKPMLSVLGTSHFDMVKTLTELDQFNPRWTNRQDKSWSEIAQEKAGPMWRQEVELLSRLEREAADGSKSRQSSSPVVRRSEAPNKARHAKTNDESEGDASEADTPRQRKNGRRLLSRKELRAASGKKRSHSSDGFSSDDGQSSEVTKKVASPKEKRGPGRPRTNKPAVVKVEDAHDRDKPLGRRRSVSHKVATRPSLSSVSEGPEVQLTKSEAVHTEQPVESPANTTNPPPSNPHSNTSTEAAIDVAGVASPGKDETDMDVDSVGLSHQEELDRQHAAEQEQAQREMEQRLKNEEDARLKQAEELKLEEQRRAEALKQAKLDARRVVITSLPQPVAIQLDPESDFQYEEIGAVDTILRYAEPLQVVYATDLSTDHVDNAASPEPLVLNLLVAPLLGKERGIDTLLQDEYFPASDWDTALSVAEEEKRFLLPLLRKSAFASHDGYDDEIIINGMHDSFTTELSKAATVHRLASQTYQKLLSAPFTLRWLSLQRTLDYLNPVLQARDIAVSEEWRSVLRNGLRHNSQKSLGETDFFENVAKHWQHPGAPQTCRHGQSLDGEHAKATDGWTSVRVIGQK